MLGTETNKSLDSETVERTGEDRRTGDDRRGDDKGREEGERRDKTTEGRRAWVARRQAADWREKEKP
ncbi:MAG: hypothetical protein ISR51_08715 [Rhodospirillales bacterium]|nr:hypothetical protein [Alphaproteobacteria bacterium]MBL6948744.1 hypothetical protein [Rhodospirillales bacterium]